MGCSASTPAAVGNNGGRSANGGGGSPADSFVRKQTAAQRREAFSSGKNAPGSAPAVAAPSPTGPKSEAEIESLKKAVAGIVLFSSMTDEQQQQIFEAMFEVKCEAGDRVIQQGEIGDCLYVVDTGVYHAYLRQKGDKEPVQTYNSGSLFGELALMYNCPRAATIKCSEAGRLWGLGRGVYEAIMRSTVNLKMDSRSQFLRSVELLSSLAEAEREALSDLLEEVTFPNGEWLWKAGDDADSLILIKQGQVEVQEASGGKDDDGDATAAPARLKDGAKLNVGDFFGTQALTNLASETPPKRRVGGIARGGAVDVYRLNRQAARNLGDLPELIINNSRVKAMRNIEWFTSIPKEDRLKLVRDVPRVGFPKDSTIFSKEEVVGNGLYVIVEGAVSCSNGGFGAKQSILTEGDLFLVEAVTEKGVVSPATYTASGSGVLCSIIDRATLRELHENREDLINRSETSTKINLDELKTIATLGVGGFGRVKMVAHKASGKHYALKCMFKGLVIAKRQTEHIMNERRLLGMCRHTFLPTLVSTFQDRDQIYVLMEPILGGELFSLVASRGRLYEPEAAFYAANVTCALDYLHTRNIAYRDLKPENLMIDSEGYLKVVDFGFAKVVEDRTFTVCGTPEYLAPETIRRQGHTTTVDWWALGVLVYELITGQSPFHGGSQMDILTRIVTGRILRDELLSSHAWAIIQDLLEVDPIKRLGSRVRGRRGVREHMFFKNHLDVEALEGRKLKPPWMPALKSSTDLSNFDDYGNEAEGDASEWERYLKIYPEAFQAW